jgi:hypothetical protein
MVNKNNIEIHGLAYLSVADLLRRLEKYKIKPKNYKFITLELDYTHCYRESDISSIKIIIPKKVISKKNE